MKVTKQRIWIALCFIVLANSSLFGQEQDSWTMAVRIAAHPTEDAAIVQKATDTNEQKIYADEQLVAKWVEVLDSVETALEKEPNLVTRRNEEGELELLVLVTENDVTEVDVRAISKEKDMMRGRGALALRVHFDEEGSKKIYNLSNLYSFVYPQRSSSYPQRYGAMIMDRKVYGAPKVVTSVMDSVIITGAISLELIEDIMRRSQVKRVYYEEDVPPYAITITPLRLIVFVGIVVVVIFGSILAKNLQKSKRPHL